MSTSPDSTNQRARVETTGASHEVVHDDDVLHAVLPRRTHKRRPLVSGSCVFTGSLHLTAPSVSLVRSRFLKASDSQCTARTWKFRTASPSFLLGVKSIGRSVRDLRLQRMLDAVSVGAWTAALLSLLQLDSRTSVGIVHELPRFHSARNALNVRGFLAIDKS